MINNGYPAPIEHICDVIVRKISLLMCAHCPRDCPFTFIDVEDRSWMSFSLIL